MKRSFSRLTKSEQRVLIAKDTLKLINLGVAKVKNGTYCQIDKGEDNLKIGEQLNKSLRKTVCTVCAKGALFLAHVDRLNNLKVPEDFDGSVNAYAFDDEETLKQRLIKNFTSLNLDMIEAAFEKRVITDQTGKLEKEPFKLTELGKACIKFGRQFGNAKVRLEEILKNIIKNKGEFKP